MGDTQGVMVIIIGNGTGELSSNPEWNCISYSANILGKGLNQTIWANSRTDWVL